MELRRCQFKECTATPTKVVRAAVDARLDGYRAEPTLVEVFLCAEHFEALGKGDEAFKIHADEEPPC